jgi:hypothetical protein
MPDLVEVLRNQPFNFALFFLVIFLGIWIANLARQAQMWPRLMHLFSELMAGMVFGALIGLALSFHNMAGVLCIGGITVGVVLIINTPKENKIYRILSVSTAMVTALLIYWLFWEDLSYLFEIIIEDFH